MPDMRKSFLVLILLGLLAVTACGAGVRGSTLSHDFTTPRDPGYPTAMPTFTPTPARLSPENPVVFASGPAPSRSSRRLSMTWLPCSAASPDERPKQVLQQLRRSRICSSTESSPFCLAAAGSIFARLPKGLATALVVTNHLGVTGYGVQFLGHSDSKFTSYFNVGTHSATADANVAWRSSRCAPA